MWDETKAIIKEARYIGSLLSHDYDKMNIQISMDDYQNALDNIEERVMKYGSQKNFEIVCNIGIELNQLQSNISKRFTNEESVLIMLKLGTKDNSQKQKSWVDTDTQNLHKTVEAAEEPNQVINIETPEEVHHVSHDGPSDDDLKLNPDDEPEINRIAISVAELKSLAD